ncbi:hypothetical protein MLD38_007771 [Melastoma candidum]|uniref:Uncharacterized protein n=1 Tax=Melastoma candidum TaxID=119954 RepID=A0ACB9RWG1_9MYRT|nr:hypothetical protein MLD38_007771 [Melastoma candidum]
MFRALSKRRGHQRYEKLGEEPAIALLERQPPTPTALPDAQTPNLSSSTSPAAVEDLSLSGSPLPAKLAKKASKSHPLFGLFDGRRKKNTTARPELVRYLAYVKEGGVWDANSSNPVACSSSG